ncbi:nucleotidyl transferase AbiEii/AbiGii toxin family protein [Hydrogenovibrio sp. 3SP14C1]|uniref:nucleotidyl transferase AbiEii/AbiGii toxin family protein n=1 Tax=Hydrogenovibrio sp. 3SP14C1 TaxID=3038774 RepID=UPI002416474C|nr:nucleotidyl transferase AbiEii/AbiGii toxin family protein [Hydrogenovibrio sp. 3SP14C1]MDG4813471.1 nucleotidyl transferase AbiEii/AbiGii toxin family protein [Hydrogenovibrio sp. 3SP14C1]
MSNTLVDLRGKLPKGLASIYQEVQAVASTLQLEVLVVGAMARDLVLVHGFNARLERGTRDIDFAVQVRNWTAFENLAEGLLAKGFRKSEKMAHRFYLEIDGDTTWEIDVMPFGELADDVGNIQWPPDESVEMSVLGFDEAFDHAFTVQIGDDSSSFMIQVASPAAMSFLKLISWLEREPLIREKDAQDIRYLMISYCKIPFIFDRMYDEGDMELQDWDLDRASARILGRDAAKLIKKETFDFLQEALFLKPEKLDLLLREMTFNMQEVDYDGSEFKVFIEALSAN